MNVIRSESGLVRQYAGDYESFASERSEWIIYYNLIFLAKELFV